MENVDRKTIIILIVAGGISFGCTRGNDGSPALWFLLIFALAVAHACVIWVTRRPVEMSWVDTFVVGSASVLGMLIDTDLDEMAGLLYGIVPITAFGLFSINILVAVIAKRQNRRKKPINNKLRRNL